MWFYTENEGMLHTLSAEVLKPGILNVYDGFINFDSSFNISNTGNWTS